jgi:hypothetical protein
MLSTPAAAIAAAPVVQTPQTAPALPFTLRSVLPAPLEPWEAEMLAYVEAEPPTTDAERDAELNETDEEYDMREPARKAAREAQRDAEIVRFGREATMHLCFLRLTRFYVEELRQTREEMLNQREHRGEHQRGA